MIIKNIKPLSNYILQITTEDGKQANFDIKPYFDFEVFKTLKDFNEFNKIKNGKYYVEWECGADLSADTIEAHMKISK